VKDHRKHIAHAYCLSVHKSQGSQFRRVYFVVMKGHWRMLSRSLIYTGITRSQKGCVVLGDMGSFLQGVKQVNHKSTVLQQLALAEGADDER